MAEVMELVEYSKDDPEDHEPWDSSSSGSEDEEEGEVAKGEKITQGLKGLH